MGRLEKSFQQGCLGKTSGNEKLVHNSDPGVFAGPVFCVTYSWSTHFRCFRGSSALLYSSFQGVFTPLKQTTEAERSKNLGSGYLAGSYKLLRSSCSSVFSLHCSSSPGCWRRGGKRNLAGDWGTTEINFLGSFWPPGNLCCFLQGKMLFVLSPGQLFRQDSHK